jgi:two-component system chemotaxis response regulator CheB
MSTKLLRVVIVDDSPVARGVLADILERDGDIRVVGEAPDGETAAQVVAREKPDLTTIDIQMPGVGGLEGIERIMASTPVPILVVTGQPTGPNGDLVFQAVRRGALDLAGKPDLTDEAAGASLRAQVRRLASIPVVRHVAPGGRRTPTPVVGVPILKMPSPSARRRRIVGIGASAGGPKAVAAVLAALPPELPAAIAVVQHLPPGFAASFVHFLSGVTRLRVQLVAKPTDIQPGTIYVAPDEKHLVAASTSLLAPREGPAVGGHRPSVTTLLASLADVFGAGAVGVVLTGIGNDGAQGLLEMKARGGLTIAQDEATSAVYGMPRAAREAGAASQVLALSLIAPAIVRATTTPLGEAADA